MPERLDETAYDREPGYATRYRDVRFRSGTGPRTHTREVAAIRRLLGVASDFSTPHADVPWLDLACGAGRLSGELPRPVVQVDRHVEMLAACDGEHARACARAADLPFTDDAFGGTLCMRLLQHIPTSEERVAILRELHRVTDGPLIASFFESRSLQHVRRVVARRLGKRRSGRGAIPARTMRADLDRAGWTLVEFAPLARFVSEQWLFLARRR